MKPWLPIYATGLDVDVLRHSLNADTEIAFLVSAGDKSWKAVPKVMALPDGRYALWHVPSGALPLISADRAAPPTSITDPWSGWQEARSGADKRTPYFGAGHPGIVWLNVRTNAREKDAAIGLSSFEWIGDHYRAIGNSASTATHEWWKQLRRDVAKVARKVIRGGASGDSKAEIYALPDALLHFETGLRADINP